MRVRVSGLGLATTLALPGLVYRILSPFIAFCRLLGIFLFFHGLAGADFGHNYSFRQGNFHAETQRWKRNWQALNRSPNGDGWQSFFRAFFSLRLRVSAPLR
jgi:hypothetical protein